MVTIAVQFLEDSPELLEISPRLVQKRLREAFSRLPVSMLLLGWNLPKALLAAVVEETTRAGIPLYRWQPLLTGDGTFVPRAEWQTIGLDGSPVPGFRGLPEFTFVCPNKPAVREAVSAHLQEVLAPPYQGIFLDRVRFPSPAANPFSHLACFCEDCCRVAQEQNGLDLAGLRGSLRSYLSVPGAARCLTASLFGIFPSEMPEAVAQGLRSLFHFRSESVSGFIHLAGELASSKGMDVGLDCFSPSLTYMVGQDLRVLTHSSDWIKVMIYGHVLGPAGLPYELLELAAFLKKYGEMPARDALAFLEQQVGFPLPRTFLDLRRQGLSSAALVSEVSRARGQGVRRLLAGLELVEIPGVSELKIGQIRQDWQAVLDAGVEGVVLSWDLWHMPLERLNVVSEILVKYS